MQVLDTFLDAMGNTPLVRLHRIARGVRPTILAKLEMLNPGGSVKDRIGLRMIEAGERAGLLKPGGTIVEPTSGNTGHGLPPREEGGFAGEAPARTLTGPSATSLD